MIRAEGLGRCEVECSTPHRIQQRRKRSPSQVGKAEPVDRAVAGYERGGPTIADEGVLADRCVATLAGDTGTSSTAT